MQAITTKYLGPTDCRGSRVKATAQAGSIILDWDDSLDVGGNHRKAAKAFVEKFNWHGTWAGGGLPDGRGDVYVCVDKVYGNSFTVEDKTRKGVS